MERALMVVTALAWVPNLLMGYAGLSYWEQAEFLLGFIGK